MKGIYADHEVSLSVDHFGDRSCLFVFTGRLNLASAEAALAVGSRLAATGRGRAFHDWSRVDRYEPSARVRFTEWLLEHRRGFENVTLHVESALVVMGVSVANMALGGFLQATRSADEFAAALGKARSSP